MTVTTRFDRPLSLHDARWAVEQAGRAPSIHNTQPWRFRWDGSAFELRADTGRGLTAGDPDGRELVLSCGAALYNLRLALRKLGFQPTVTPLPDRADPRLLARVTVCETTPADNETRLAYSALLRRHTHRGTFDDRPLAANLAVVLQRAAEEELARLIYVHHPGQRRRVLSLARAAERELADDDRIRTEIAGWTPAPGSGRRDGVPATAYAADPPRPGDDLAPREFDQDRRYGKLDVAETPPGVIAVLVTTTDLEPDWLSAGQALERVLIAAAQHGAFAALHSQVVELPHRRAELRRELCTDGYPQIALRFGYAPDVTVTPRRPVDDVLDLT